ncbi:MAG: T9SS type A sorting domain-containing protein [Flavobacteriales bacterium]|nr:T9SS type A sorting domain-containing protein [Flavobacteriales bacterium]
MKKTFTLLSFLMVLSTSDSSAQNYQPINSHSLQVFYQETPYFTPYSGQTDANMWGTRIDSISVTANNDTIYFNYPIARDTAAENGQFGSIWWDAPNWSGKQTRIEPSGSTWFYTHNDDSVKIEPLLSLNQEWLAYTYLNGDSLVGKITNVTWEDDGWITDSVKTITFSRYSSGNLIWEGMPIELYKENGFRKMVDFVKFPNDTIPIHRVDRNTINQYSPGYLVNGTIRPEPTIGDGFYTISSCQSYGVSCYGSNGSSSESVLGVTTDSISGQITASVMRNTLYNSTFQSSTIDLIYELLPDTFVPIYNAQFNEDLMPREGGSAYSFSWSHLVNTDDSCTYPLVTIHSLPAECTGVEYHFAPYIGIVYKFWSEDDYYCTGWAYHYFYYSYLKVGDLECGEQLVVGTEENQRPEFSIYPNPTNGVFQMQLSDWNAAKDFSVTVYDMLGRRMENLNPQTSTIEIDASAWPNGVYSISLVNQSGHNIQNGW